MSCNGCEEKNLIIVLEVSDGTKNIQVFHDFGNMDTFDYSDAASDGTKYIQVFHNILSDIEEFDYSDAKLQELKTQHPTYEECVHFLDLSV